MKLQISSEELSFEKPLLQLEWLETNGLGGYASDTVIGCHTRKYHGWLNVADDSLDGKFVLLSKVELEMKENDQWHSLSTNQYPGSYYPDGYKRVSSFQMSHCPETIYKGASGESCLSQAMMMIQGENTLVIKYKNLGQSSISLKLTPLMAYRNIHQLTKRNEWVNFAAEPMSVSKGWASVYKIRPYEGMTPCFFGSDRALDFVASPDWNFNVEYQQELERGFDFQEDLFRFGFFQVELGEGEIFYLCVSTESPSPSVKALWQNEEKRRKAVQKKFGNRTDLSKLKQNAEKFIIDNSKGGRSIVAGYPWFNEWGRDAMISVPGLTFYCGELQEGIEVLKTFARHEKNGLIPNYLPVGKKPEPSYNSIDSSLWFFWALSEYYEMTGDKDTVENCFYESMRSIISAYFEGRVPFARLMPDGLIWAGDEQTQLTWMDATVNGQPVTPRYGYAVEINALWINGLDLFVRLFPKKESELVGRIQDTLKKAKKSFVDKFWDDERGYLADVVNDHGRDFSIRPNQIFAVSLPVDLLEKDKMERVVSCVQNELVTSFGLRTLSSEHPSFRPSYHGCSEARDSAYHQGTVWTWPVGHFVDAYFRVSGNKAKASKELKNMFSPILSDHLYEDGVYSLAEIFDGSPPHRPSGCIAQAWSVAETIRAFELIGAKGKKNVKKVKSVRGQGSKK